MSFLDNNEDLDKAFSEDIQSTSEDKKNNSGKVNKIVLIVVVVIAILGCILYAVGKNVDNSEKNNAQNASSEKVVDVTPDSHQRMNDGTILTFGNQDPQAKAVTIFASPTDMSREGRLVNGKPSALLTAVKDKNVRVNLYLAPNSDSESQGVDSMIKSAACKVVQDKSPGRIFTLSSIVNASRDFKGNESTVEMAKKMGMNSDLKCPKTSPSAASSTANNAIHFMTQYQLDKPDMVVSGTKGVTGFSRLSDDWVKKAINGDSADSFVSAG